MKKLNFTLASEQLNSPKVDKLMRALTAQGARAMFVGGCVRDAILQIPHSDIDIAIDIPPQQVINLLDRQHILNKPLGIKHGSVLAIIEGEAFNITTLRADIATDGRWAEVEFIDNWALDANRRDFTINALYADTMGNIYDPVDGYEDILQRRVRFIGNADARIQEDYLRILRYFRFYATYSDLNPDATTLKSCHKYAPQLVTLSPERNWSEFKKILSSPNAALIIDLMNQTNVLPTLLPGITLHPNEYLANLIIADINFPASPLRRLAAIIDQDIETLNLLRLSLKEITTLKQLLHFKNQPVTDIKSFIYTHGDNLAIDLALLTGNQDLLYQAMSWQNITFPLTGNDLIRVGVKPGPALGVVLQDLQNWWLAMDRIPDKAQCLEYWHNRNNL